MNAPHLCARCSTQRQHEEKLWTPGEVIVAIRRWAEQHGRPPVASEWVNAGVWEDGSGAYRTPSYASVYAGRNPAFASWADAIAAAGFPRPPQGLRRGYEYRIGNLRALFREKPLWTYDELTAAIPDRQYLSKTLRRLTLRGELEHVSRGVYKARPSVTDFPYRLVVLTHPPGEPLAAALAAFEQHARPAPAEVIVVVDGSGFYTTEALAGRFPDAQVTVWPDTEQRGFCVATARAWKHAAEGPGPLHVFYLEHDFLLTRDIDLRSPGALLDAHQRLAQMALMRNAVNDQEIAAGGLYESRRDEYEWHRSTPIRPVSEPVPLEEEWLSHRSYFTTNPSLMRRSFMQEHPWPEQYGSECEGKFGLDLLAAGFSFGVWSSGEVWCEHVGVRSGHSY